MLSEMKAGQEQWIPQIINTITSPLKCQGSLCSCVGVTSQNNFLTKCKQSYRLFALSLIIFKRNLLNPVSILGCMGVGKREQVMDDSVEKLELKE